MGIHIRDTQRAIVDALASRRIQAFLYPLTKSSAETLPAKSVFFSFWSLSDYEANGGKVA
jgi:hypothetical protein